MSWSILAGLPTVLFDANGDPYSGAVLKAYLSGTTTSTSLAIDSAGSSPQTSITYNAEGKLEVSGNEIQAYIDSECKWGIFANATDAAASTPFYMGPFDTVPQLSAQTSTDATIQTFVTKAAATAATLTAGQAVQTLGYAAAGDGGAALYEVVAAGTGTDDGGSFIDSDTLNAFQLKLIGDSFNIIQWGADGGGSVDNLLTAQAAFNWAPNVGEINVPKGDFFTSGTLKFKSNSTISGTGFQSRIFATLNSSYNLTQAETISAVSGEYDENIIIRDLMLDHNRTIDFTVEAVMSMLLIGSRNITIDNVHFKNPNSDGIYVNYDYAGTGHADNQPDNIKILNSLFTGANHNRNGLSFISGTDIKVDNCRFIGMTRDNMPGAIDMEPNNTNNLIEGVNISNCYFNGCKASIVSDYVPNDSNTQIRNVNINNIIINSSSAHTTTTPTEFFGHTGIAMAHVRGVNISNINIKDTAHASMWFADIDRLNIENAVCVSPTAAAIIRDCTDVSMNNFYLESTNATTFTSVVTNGLYLRYETTGAGHTGVRRGKFTNGTINCTAGAATTNTAFFGEGHVQDIEVNNVFLQGNWANGIVQANGSSGDALRWTVNARIEDGNSMTPLVAAFGGAITDSGNGEWNIPGVTDGVATFAAETTKVITVGEFAELATARMSVSAIDNTGTIGISADRTSTTQFTITASSAFTGDIYWKIVHN